MQLKKITRRAFIVGGIGLVTYSYLERFFINIKHYTIAIENLPRQFNGFTILQLSDLHSKWFGENQRELLDIIDQHKFDIVAITGDLVNKDNPLIEPGIQLIQGLKEKPVFFVHGNHDVWSNYNFRTSIEALGVRILENKAVKYLRGNSHLWLLGVNDPYLGLDNLEFTLRGITDNNPKILLAHAPSIFAKASSHNIDMVLVGHTHGGQVRLPLIGAVVAPGQGLFPKFDYGLFIRDKTRMIINAGLGESVLPIRFNIKPEIALITLVHTKE